MSSEQLRAFSFGGGVQSVACLVLAAQGRINFREFVFSNVGDDSEHPATLRYIEEHAMPFAGRHGLRIHVVQRKLKNGEVETLYQKLTNPDKRSLPIPVFYPNGAPAGRACTQDFKVKTLLKWHKAQGATAENPAVVGIGISLDEFQRMRSSSGIDEQVLEYPLIDLRLTREDCKRIIADAGLPVPPKSSCFFCPFHTLKVWQDMRDREPELFWRSVDLEQTINRKREAAGMFPVYLTRKLKPLDEVTTADPSPQLRLFEPEERHSCGPFVCTNLDQI